MDAVLEAFEAEGRTLLGVVRRLRDADLVRVTNCPPWNVAELVVHVAGSIGVRNFAAGEPGTAPREAADYYRRPERDTAEYRERSVRLAQESAQAVLARMTVAECLDQALAGTITTMAGANLDDVVMVDRVGPMRLRDWLATRVIALAAHGLDVAITLQLRPWTTAAASAVMEPVFRSLLGRPQPDDWSDQRLLALATGRAELTDRERVDLGQAAERFPLLS